MGDTQVCAVTWAGRRVERRPLRVNASTDTNNDTHA